MQIIMAGLDYGVASVALREQLSFTKAAVEDALPVIMQNQGILGAVLLSTCNRTELYLSLKDGAAAQPDRILCAVAGLPYEDFAFTLRRDDEAITHILEVACGMKSQILGEDQILTQVKTAAAISAACGTCDAVLATLFRTAAACGKQVKTGGRLTGVPTSAAHLAVAAAASRLHGLGGKRAMVIGNGEMGRLTAALLRDEGCGVTVTLRSYRHGETVVPPGCAVVSYDDRFPAMEGVDLVVSATTSPHHTVFMKPFLTVKQPPNLLIDLAMPRDIDPTLSEVPGVTVLNVDDLGRGLGADEAALARARGVVEEQKERFYQWALYREGMPHMETVKEALRHRIHGYLEPDMDAREAADLTIDKVVDLLAQNMTEGFTVEALKLCAAKIRLHTR